MKKQVGYVLLSCFLSGGAFLGIVSLYILKPEGFNLRNFLNESKAVQVLSVGTLLFMVIGTLCFLKSVHMKKEQ